MRTSILATAFLVAAAAPLGACAGDNGGLFSSGDRVYNQDTVNRGARDGDRIYRDRDGRYYCKRENGTTGTLVGAGAGALLGNLIAPGGSKTIGTILGGAAGAVGGRAIDRADLACK
ncbi:glycine zipper 2TM domain-containing protein [Hephaestia sp. GCM10023244]|uniref:glycine zipper 2TM domain-containing protein n=1 Tax=unclassified Hephaestia TaxID=2631281 RepID=UPI002076DF58|nr:glycine zipper 2TM domain-containing protein [Hephaestia sp. MAHUQ-44]MCM8731035.1 glycine zipper 2TM domain-containing protein [Hephaestia sp. MAHUQ-44]